MDLLFEKHRDAYISYRASLTYPLHWHKEVEIAYLFTGESHMIVSGKHYTLHEGDCALIFPYLVHGYFEEQNINAGVLIFLPEIPIGMQSIFTGRLPFSPVIRADEIREKRLTPLILETIDLYKNSSPAVQKSYLSLLIAKLVDPSALLDRSGNGELNVEDCLTYCQNHYKSPITLEKVARALQTHRGAVSSFFNRVMNQSFCSYINALRIQDAMEMLKQKNMPIAEIAHQCGFSTVRTFDRVFLAQIGITPMQYRNRL